MSQNRRSQLSADRLLDTLAEDILHAADEEMIEALAARGGPATLHRTRRAIAQALDRVPDPDASATLEREGGALPAGGQRSPDHRTDRGSP